MLKWYAETFKLTQKQMTSKALRRIWVLTGLSLFVFPALVVLEFGKLTGAALLAARVAYYIGATGFLCLVFTKFTNRFWARDKYLDEWEKDRKHQAMAFAFQVMLYILGAILLVSGFSPVFDYGQDVFFSEFGFRAMGVIVMGVMSVGLFTMQIYLLVTTKPIDSFDELHSGLSLDEVI